MTLGAKVRSVLAGNIARIVISLCVLWFVVSQSDIALSDLSLRQASPPLLALAVVAMLALSLPHAARWILVLGELGESLDFRSALRFVFVGYFFGQMLPSSVGGDAARAWCAYRARISPITAATSVVLDRLSALAGVLLILFVVSPWLTPLLPFSTREWAVMLIPVTGAATLVVLSGLDYLPRFVVSNPLLGRLAGFSASLRRVLFTGRSALATIALSVGVQLALGVIVYVIALSLDVSVGLRECLLLMPLVTLVAALPISIAGWGLREGAMVVAFGYVQVPPPAALAVSLVFGLIVLAASLPGALLWWRRGHLHGERESGVEVSQT